MWLQLGNPLVEDLDAANEDRIVFSEVLPTLWRCVVGPLLRLVKQEWVRREGERLRFLVLSVSVLHSVI